MIINDKIQYLIKNFFSDEHSTAFPSHHLPTAHPARSPQPRKPRPPSTRPLHQEATPDPGLPHRPQANRDPAVRRQPPVRILRQLRGIQHGHQLQLHQTEDDATLQGLPQGSPVHSLDRIHHRHPKQGLLGGLHRIQEQDDVPSAEQPRHQQEHEEDPVEQADCRSRLLGEEEEEQRGGQEVQGRAQGEGGRDRHPLRFFGAGERSVEVQAGNR